MRLSPRQSWSLVAAGVLLVVGSVVCYFVVLHRRGQYHLDAAEDALKARDFALADSHLERCLTAWPDDPSALLLSAQAARLAGDFDRARKALRRCEGKSVPSATLQLERTLLAVQQGDLSDARRLLSFCEEKPDAPEAPLVREAVVRGCLDGLLSGGPPERGQLLAAVRRAVDVWIQRAAVPAQEAIGLVWSGRMHAAAGDHARAVAEFRRALVIAPGLPEGKLALAETIVEERPQEAAGLLEELHRASPAGRRIRFALATVRHGLGDLEAARDLLDGLLEDKPDDASALTERALLAVHLGDTAGAEARARRAVALAPNSPRAHWVLSRCLQAAGKPDEAKEYYDRFRRLEPRIKGGPS